MSDEKWFIDSELQAIAKAIGDTSSGLSGSEIGHILDAAGITDIAPDATKWMRIYNALAERQNRSQNRRAVLHFIRLTMRPERYLDKAEKYETMRGNLNRALAFSGLAVDATGKLFAVDRAQTINEANSRAADLKADLIKRGVHPDVLRFCKAELVADNYFHAVLEASKSIADKLRAKTGLTEDGQKLVDQAMSGIAPVLKINPYVTESQQSEQRGFVNLVKGVFGMFRNPTAHEARILWPMTKEDAEDLLSLASLIHRRLDAAK